MAEQENPDKKVIEPVSFSVSSVTSKPNRNNNFKISKFNKLNLDLINKHKRWGSKALVALFLLASLIAGYLGAFIEHSTNSDGVTFASLGKQEKIVSSQSQLINQIAKSVGPSVVSVNVNITSNSNDSGLGFFGFTQPNNMQAAGTGIILSSDGLIITNRHVVPDGTTNVSVTLNDGTQLNDVSVIGRTNQNNSLDIAFLKINNTEGHKLTPAVIGDSSQVQVGDSVVAIGNALGQFQNTVTSGIISGYGRSVQASSSSGSQAENLDDLFQTDAAINEGNSGGPLVNLNGQVIGINTAVAGNAQNIGFAIPINDVKGLIEQVSKSGKFASPYLGVRYIPLTADVASTYHLSVNNGAYIAPSNDSANNPSVIPGSPAEKAGLKVGDIIVSVNGTKIDQAHSLTSLLDKHQPGDTVKLTILRHNKTKTFKVQLGTMPNGG